MRLAEELLGAIVAKGDTLEQVINSQQFHDSLSMRDVGICE